MAQKGGSVVIATMSMICQVPQMSTCVTPENLLLCVGMGQLACSHVNPHSPLGGLFTICAWVSGNSFYEFLACEWKDLLQSTVAFGQGVVY